MVTVTATGCELWPIVGKCCNYMYLYVFVSLICVCVFVVSDVCLMLGYEYGDCDGYWM